MTQLLLTHPEMITLGTGWGWGRLEKGEWVDEVCAVEDMHTYVPGNAVGRSRGAVINTSVRSGRYERSSASASNLP